ncbi:MAG TPA: LamG-like jellyroll fold domain-containing protein [Tepidisphaeraceae bacterium]|nr:LamG-like jellyroll fold domain-containing protein [Tepidisphaeraceae bacterium]
MTRRRALALATAAGLCGWTARPTGAMVWNGPDHPERGATSTDGLTDRPGYFANVAIVNNSYNSTRGTATYLGNGWIITARHMVSGPGYGTDAPASNLSFQGIPGSLIVPVPNSAEIALIKLQSNPAMTALPSSVIYTGSGEGNALVQMGGYGLWGWIDTPSPSNVATFHRGYNVSWVNGAFVSTQTDGEQRLKDLGLLETGAMSGDSGSALWMLDAPDSERNDWSKYKLAGILATSQGAPWGADSNYARVQVYGNLIRDLAYGSDRGFNWARGIADTFSWNNDPADGVTNGNNWQSALSPAFPNGAGDFANVGNASTGANNQTINLGQDITVGEMSIGSTNNGTGIQTIAAGGPFKLIFDNLSAPGLLFHNAQAKADVISAPIVIGGTGTLMVVNPSGTAMTLSGGITSGKTSGTQTLRHTSGGLAISGAIGDGATGGKISLNAAGGSLVLSGNNTYTGGTTINDSAVSVTAGTTGTTASSIVLSPILTSASLTVSGSAAVNASNVALGGTSTVNLNGGTLTTGSIARSNASANAVVNFNGGTLKAAANNQALVGVLTAARVGSGGAIIDTNGFDASVAQPLIHDSALGATPDGGLTKKSAGVLTLSAAASYTGATTVQGGTLRLASGTPPTAVGAYSFDNVTTPGGVPVSSGVVAGNSVVVNGGSGGTAMNGTANHANHTSAGIGGATLVAGKFGNALRLDGQGSSIDIANRIVDQAGTGAWTFSTWVKTTAGGSAMVSKNQGGAGWTSGYSVFYLGSNPISGTFGPNPTAVRWGGGFVQGNAPVADGAWHMLTFVSDGSTKSVYVDGVATGLNYSDFNNADTATFTRLGFNTDNAAGDGARHFNGDLDEMKFFNGALTPQQIQSLFATNTIPLVGGAQYLPAGTTVNLTAGGATLDLNGNNQTVGGLAGVTGSQVILGGGAVLTTGGSNANTTFAGNLSGAGGVTKVGTGALTLSGSNTHTGGTTASAGKIVLGASLTTSSSMNATGGTIELAAGGSKIVKTAAVTVNGGGKLDLKDNRLAVTGGDDLAAITTLVKNGRSGGSWNGSGITSSLAASSNGLTGLGIATAVAGQVFFGQTLGAGDVMVAYTYVGDADLNRRIDGDDYFRIDSSIGSAAAATWFNGDFDYNGKINGDDYFWIDQNVAMQGSVTLPAGAGIEGAGVAGATAVPEPSTAVAAAIAVGAAAVRRRRHQTR